MSRVLICLPHRGFDPTEAAVPWKVLSGLGHEVVVATPDGNQASADPVMVTGQGLGVLKPVLRADATGRAAHEAFIESQPFEQSITYEQAADSDFDALILPGGHDKTVKPYLESPLLQRVAGEFMAANKPVGAICHGVLILARAQGPEGRSILHGRKVTSLTNRMEKPAHMATRAWMGDYYRTYPEITTEDEVRSALAAPADFYPGPFSTRRDTLKALQHGFTVRDGNLLTARWPGDAHQFSVAIHEMLAEAVDNDARPSQQGASG